MKLETLQTDTRYSIIYTDPPWNQKKGNIRKCRPNQNRNLDYETLSMNEISLLQQSAKLLEADKANVFMWTIDKYLHDTEKMMKELGYELHARMIWDKTNGIAPAFTIRFSHEYLLWFYRKGHILMPSDETRGKYTTVFREAATKHSVKPVLVYEMLEDMFPNCNKLEMFARKERDGWSDGFVFFNGNVGGEMNEKESIGRLAKTKSGKVFLQISPLCQSPSLLSTETMKDGLIR